MEHGPGSSIVAITMLLVIGIGPLLTGLAGVFVPRTGAPQQVTPGRSQASIWPIIVNSTLLYVVANNIIFFIQELFLVLSKAWVPGLRPTLYHNNHGWSGDAPIAALLQGSGALAIIVCGLLFLVVLHHMKPSRGHARLLVFWLAQQGLVQGLLQIPVAVMVSGTDVSQALDFLNWSPAALKVLGVASLIAIALVGIALSRSLLTFAGDDSAVVTRAARTNFVIRVGLIPIVLGIVLVVPFRLPMQLFNAVLPQLVLAVASAPWIVAAAWMARRVEVVGSESSRTIAYWPIAAAIFIFAVFHLLLRPGIDFF